MQWAADGTHKPTCIFEAACFGYAVKPVCRCGHSSTFAPHGLWWLFRKRHWNDRFTEARARLWCRSCQAAKRGKVRPVRIEYVRRSEADFALPLPDEREWKRAVSRFRA